MTDINKSVKTTNYTCKGNCSECDYSNVPIIKKKYKGDDK